MSESDSEEGSLADSPSGDCSALSDHQVQCGEGSFPVRVARQYIGIANDWA